MTGREVVAEATIVPSALGRCAIAHGPDGIMGVALPSHDQAETLEALRLAVQALRPGRSVALRLGPATGESQIAVEALGRHLEGDEVDLRSLRLDTEGLSDFRIRAHEAARAIPRGEVQTYGELARVVGSVARAIGRAMAQNPFPILVPCHRVVAANGLPGGFSAPGGLVTKAALLAIEGGWLPSRAAGRSSPTRGASLDLFATTRPST